jgi:hypothetical protein
MLTAYKGKKMSGCRKIISCARVSLKKKDKKKARMTKG